jgi:DNA-binding MarR family transcriptional regulator
MKGWLKKAWHDPVGSKVIAGAILGGLGAIAAWLWSASDFSLNGALIWSGAKATVSDTVGWLAAPVTIPRLGLWLIICIGVAGWALIALERMRRARLAIATEAREEVRETLVTAIQAQLKRRLPAVTLTYTQRLMFHFLYRNYPGAANLSSLGGMIGLQYPAAEKLFEEMSETGLIEMNDVVNPRSNRTEPLVRLTKDGRNYCLENELDRPPAPPPPR